MTFTERLYTNIGSRIGFPESGWRQDAACRGMDSDMFFPSRGVGFFFQVWRATMSECRHFWSAWFLVGPKQAERACTYCQVVEKAGEGANDG